MLIIYHSIAILTAFFYQTNAVLVGIRKKILPTWKNMKTNSEYNYVYNNILFYQLGTAAQSEKPCFYVPWILIMKCSGCTSCLAYFTLL